VTLAVIRVLAPNPSIATLDGTNTWIVGEDPTIVIDPGPEIDEHLKEVARAAGRVAHVLVTHDHEDHAAGAVTFARLVGANVTAWRLPGAAKVHDGQGFTAGGVELIAMHSPGHSADHVVFSDAGSGALFTGDAVLGEGSVFVVSRLGEYLAALERLDALGLEVLCPGHGPAVWDPSAKLGEYLAHRAERERKLLAALEAGARTEDELLDAAWADAPAALRPAAALTLRAHAGKLADEGRLPDDVKLA